MLSQTDLRGRAHGVASQGRKADRDEELLALLASYVSPINARAMLRRARTRAVRLGGATDATLLRELRTSITMLVRSGQRQVAIAALEAVLAPVNGDQREADTSRIEIASENDIAAARVLARGLCTRGSLRGFAAQKIITAVSELARNIVLYAGRGAISVDIEASPRRVVVIADDQGPGIANLDEILAGRYRSKTGLGRGLIGIRRLADTFDIETGTGGTRIQISFSLGSRA